MISVHLGLFPSNIQYEWQLLKIKTKKLKVVVRRAYYKIVLIFRIPQNLALCQHLTCERLLGMVI